MSSSKEKATQRDASGTAAGGTEGRRHGTRRWYHPRPAPRCAAGLAGFNYSYWMLIVVLVLLVRGETNRTRTKSHQAVSRRVRRSMPRRRCVSTPRAGSSRGSEEPAV
jgi:hypothetical protein